VASGTLSILIKAQDAASGVLKGITGETDKMSSKWQLAGAAIGGAATTVAGALADMAREAAADQAAMEAVRVAVENTGASWDDAGGKIDDYMLKMRDMAAIDDAELKPALAGLIAITGDYERSLELASLAADLAKGKNMSLAAASDLVGKVAQGNTSTLSRYGIVLNENATAEEALAELQKRFAGQAEAYGATTQGQLEALSIKVGDFRESIGGALGPAQGMMAMLPGLSVAFSGVGAVLGTIIPLVSALALPVLAVGAGIALLAVAWSNNWFDIQGKTKAAWEFIKPLIEAGWQFVEGVISLGLQVLSGDWEGAWTTIQDTLAGVWESIQTTASGAWEGLTTTIKGGVNAVIGFINSLITAWNALELRIPGFSHELPIEIPGIGKTIGWPGVNLQTPDLPLIPFLAAGTRNWTGGLALVGERGPELVALPRGANVYSNRETQAMMRGGDTYNVTIHSNAPVSSWQSDIALARAMAG
jgi:hypothetical protein